MDRSRSKRQVIILDSCFSGAFADGLSAKDDGTINIREQLGGEGRAVLTSSSSTQYSFEQAGSDLSIYTRYLIEGITTGTADQDNDEFISIDELHEYASRKVRESHPAMKPEIYAVREGYKIRLTKVPPGDPKQKYRKEVTRYLKRGEISFVGRQTLNVLRVRLGLFEVETIAIEDEILADARQEFREKLQQYKQAFVEVFQQEDVPTEEEINQLRQNLQQILGLRNEDTKPIETEVKAQIETYKQQLQKYEQLLTEAMRQEYPLSEATRYHLQQIQQQELLDDKDIARIERRVVAEIKVYRQKLQQYEEAFTSTMEQEYPLSEVKRIELQEFLKNLGLRNEDVALIEVRITAQIEDYWQRLEQYEKALMQEVEHEYPLRDNIKEDLKRFQYVLELNDSDILLIEKRIFESKESPNFPVIESNISDSVPSMDGEFGGNSNSNAKYTSISASISNSSGDLNDTEAYKNRGDDYYDQGKLDLAIADYSQAISLDPQFAFAYNNRGNVYYDQGKLDLAITDYSQAISLDPQDALAYHNRGIVYEKQGKLDLAIADYSQAISLNPQDAFAYNNRGNVYYDQGKLELAIADYSQAISLDPQFAVAYHNRGIVYENQGKLDLGIAGYSQGKLELAIADYSQAISLNPQFASAYRCRGNAYRKQGSLDLAIKDLEMANKFISTGG